ncbi:MAG TPA: P-loop NTPase fold protein, partial [Sumerlaeia bacterium]|nr:P-loop NTPase fold protein [Sumerlaeia bacterium]
METPTTGFELIPLLDDQPIEALDGDSLGLMPFAKMVAGVAAGTDGPFTIGVHGQWGYGKTTLLHLTKRLIDEGLEVEDAAPGKKKGAPGKKDKGKAKKRFPNVVTVWFNAWQFEREEHPLFPLIAAISHGIEQHIKDDPGVGETVKTGFKRIGATLRSLARGMKFSGEVGVPLLGNVGMEYDAAKALQAEEVVGGQTHPLQAEMLYHAAFRTLSEVMREETTKDKSAKRKIIVFIDDLDRCHPDKGVFLLESIKLVLAQPGFIFVLAVDRPVIESYLERRYRREFGLKGGDYGRLYLDKIIQLPIPIPSHRTRFKKHLEDLVKRVAESHATATPMVAALRGVLPVLSTGARENPRTLNRLVNNFLLDCYLWPHIERAEDDPYRDLTKDVAAALAFNRVLPERLGEDDYKRLVQNQNLCDAILHESEFDDLKDSDPWKKRREGFKTPPGSDPDTGAESPPSPLGETRIRDDQPSPEIRLLERIYNDPDLLEVLRDHGQKWLEDKDLRVAVQEFASTQRQENPTVQFPDSIQEAIRRSLRLKEDEPLTHDRLAGVTTIDLSGKEIHDADLAHLKELKSLTDLYLSDTPVTDAGVAHLKELESLMTLSLVDTQVTDAGLAHLKELKSLTTLALSRTQVTDAGLAHLKKLRSLTGLYLSDTPVT